MIPTSPWTRICRYLREFRTHGPGSVAICVGCAPDANFAPMGQDLSLFTWVACLWARICRYLREFRTLGPGSVAIYVGCAPLGQSLTLFTCRASMGQVLSLFTCVSPPGSGSLAIYVGRAPLGQDLSVFTWVQRPCVMISRYLRGPSVMVANQDVEGCKILLPPPPQYFAYFAYLAYFALVFAIFHDNYRQKTNFA